MATTAAAEAAEAAETAKAHTRFAKDQLKAFVERIERLEEEKKAISDDIRDVYAEAKGNGFDTKIMRKVISIRKMEDAERQEPILWAIAEAEVHERTFAADLNWRLLQFGKEQR